MSDFIEDAERILKAAKSFEKHAQDFGQNMAFNALERRAQEQKVHAQPGDIMKALTGGDDKGNKGVMAPDIFSWEKIGNKINSILNEIGAALDISLKAFIEVQPTGDVDIKVINNSSGKRIELMEKMTAAVFAKPYSDRLKKTKILPGTTMSVPWFTAGKQQ